MRTFFAASSAAASWPVPALRRVLSPAPSRYSSRIVQDLAGMAELAPAWDRLASQGTPMQHYIWARTCAEVFGSRIQALVIESLGEVVAIAPLARREGYCGRLESIGVAELFEPTDFLYADDSALAMLVRAATALGAPLDLGRMPANSPALRGLGKGWRCLSRTSRAGACPYIELGPQWTNPEQQFNARRRGDFRRAERHAQELGEVRFEILAPPPRDLERLLAEAYQTEATGWKGECGSALALGPLRGVFFRRYARAALERGILRLCFMRIGAQAVAMQIAVECSERFWLFKIGYDERFARCSPGTLLMMHTVKYAAERGLRSYELLGEAAPWTRVWTRAEEPMVRLKTYPATVRGLGAFCSDAVNFVRSRV